MDAVPEKRRYSEKEIGKILKRASELQRAEPARPDPAGLSLAELEEIAQEAGIDVANVRRAAAELGTRAGEGWDEKLLGAPLRFRVERLIPGELSADDLGGLVPVIQQAAGGVGQASVVGKTLTWSSKTSSQARSLQVLVMPRDGETLVRLEERSDSLAGQLHGGIVGGAGLGIGIPAGIGAGAATASVALGLGAGAAIVGGTYWVTRWIFGRSTRDRERKLKLLLDQLSDLIGAATSQDARRSPRG